MIFTIKRILLILFMISLFASECVADEWDNEDLSLISIFTIATIIDWGQTRDIVKNSEEIYANGYYEKNNIYLGRNPSMSKVDTYMPLAIIGVISISHTLPKDMRVKFLYGMSFLELGTIYNNHKIGLTINF